MYLACQREDLAIGDSVATLQMRHRAHVDAAKTSCMRDVGTAAAERSTTTRYAVSGDNSDAYS